MASPKSLAVTDRRLPLTIALAEGVASGQFSPEMLVRRKKELSELVVQAAQMFGFQSKTSLGQALDFSLGLVSLALAHSSEGENRPEQWIGQLLEQNWKDLARQSISLVRKTKEEDEAHAYLFEAEKDLHILRHHLRDFSLRRDRQGQWMGYKAFLEYQETRRQQQGTDRLVRWLIQFLLKRPAPWKESEDEPANAEEALNTIFFRNTTGLGFGRKDILLTQKDFQTVRGQYDASPAQWIKEGQKRYELLQLALPADLVPFADTEWFRNILGKGPPKVKKWETEDIPGVTGLYYYQNFL